MIKEAIGGFCMALADSVPGVSGGTVAFIMGFYDQFIGSVHDLAFGKMEDKKKAIAYLIKLGIGWIIGMGLAVVILSALFESHIYVVSSLFIGFIAGAIPLIIREERDGFKQFGKGILFLILGIVLVAGITWLNGRAGTSSMDLSHFQLGNAIKLFFIGMIAISAMFLPGISGSTLLLIFGLYLPVITAIKDMLHLDFSSFWTVVIFGCGVLVGIFSVVKLIRRALEKYRAQTIYLIIGLMLGSIFAVVMGPTTLDAPQPAMGIHDFSILFFLIGGAVILGLQKMKDIKQ